MTRLARVRPSKYYSPPAIFRAARAASRVIPARFRRRVVGAMGSLVYAGDAVACPCCGGVFRGWRPPRDACPRCGALDRQRLLYLYFERRPQLLQPGMALLHFAPEPIMQKLFRETDGLEYRSADIESPLADDRADITRMPYPDRAWDAVICTHVLEHVDDDRAAMREIARVLRPGGWALVMVPIERGTVTREDPAVTDPEERLRLFGQEDHLRIHGDDFPDRLREEGLEVTVERMASELPEEEILRWGLNREDDIFLCRPAGGTGG